MAAGVPMPLPICMCLCSIVSLPSSTLRGIATCPLLPVSGPTPSAPPFMARICTVGLCCSMGVCAIMDASWLVSTDGRPMSCACACACCICCICCSASTCCMRPGSDMAMGGTATTCSCPLASSRCCCGSRLCISMASCPWLGDTTCGMPGCDRRMVSWVGGMGCTGAPAAAVGADMVGPDSRCLSSASTCGWCGCGCGCPACWAALPSSCLTTPPPSSPACCARGSLTSRICAPAPAPWLLRPTSCTACCWDPWLRRVPSWEVCCAAWWALGLDMCPLASCCSMLAWAAAAWPAALCGPGSPPDADCTCCAYTWADPGEPRSPV
mmetsp:Transcript_1066/g.2948  ORF Transcript_1066/g.2948 Transcript_1066/m.2948 type:complete len:325 (-) Transcript_1066:808-1782(-)